MRVAFEFKQSYGDFDSVSGGLWICETGAKSLFGDWVVECDRLRITASNKNPKEKGWRTIHYYRSSSNIPAIIHNKRHMEIDGSVYRVLRMLGNGQKVWVKAEKI